MARAVCVSKWKGGGRRGRGSPGRPVRNAGGRGDRPVGGRRPRPASRPDRARLAEQILGNAHREAETIAKQGRAGRQGGESSSAAKSSRPRSIESAATSASRRGGSTSEPTPRPEARADQPEGKRDGRGPPCRWPTSRRSCGSGRPRSSRPLRLSSRRCSGSAGFPPKTLGDALLKRIEDELAAEVGSLVLKYQAPLQETCQQKSREILDDDDPALRRVAHRRDDRQHGRHPQRRDERADHRPRGAEHPRLREGDRRRRDRRRHARRRHRHRFRQRPPRDRQDRARAADPGRANSSDPDRGDRQGNAGRHGAAHPPARPARRPWRRTSSACTRSCSTTWAGFTSAPATRRTC